MTPRNEWAARTVLLTGSLLIGFAMLELGCGLHKGKRWLVEWLNLVVSAVAEALDEQDSWAIYDRLLGQTLRPSAVSPYGVFDGRGFRLPSPVLDGTPVIVAMGGSPR